MKIDFEFPADEGSNNGTYSLVPVGIHDAVVDKIEERVTKSGNTALDVTYRICGGVANNRLVFEMLNIFHPNPTASAIARRRLLDVAKAVGRVGCPDTDELVGRELSISVKHRYSDYRQADEAYVASISQRRGMPTAAPVKPQTASVTESSDSPW